MAQEGRAILLEMLAKAHDAGCGDDGAQRLFAFEEREWPKVEAAEEQQVEGEIAQVLAPPPPNRSKCRSC
jgi:hypothetical protein